MKSHRELQADHGASFWLPEDLQGGEGKATRAFQKILPARLELQLALCCQTPNTGRYGMQPSDTLRWGKVRGRRRIYEYAIGCEVGKVGNWLVGEGTLPPSEYQVKASGKTS